MTLTEMQEHFRVMYGRRNRVFFNGLGEMLGRLSISVGNVQHAIRNSGGQHVHSALAGVAAWVFAIANHFESSFGFHIRVLRKYGVPGCAYCGSSPCDCSEQRKVEAREAGTWRDFALPTDCSLRDLQQHLASLYGSRNKSKGLDYLALRLFRETAELQNVHLRLAHEDMVVAKLEDEYGSELADVLAWVIAMANYLGFDLEIAILDRYRECPDCGMAPCTCGRYLADGGKLARRGSFSAGCDSR